MAQATALLSSVCFFNLGSRLIIQLDWIKIGPSILYSFKKDRALFEKRQSIILFNKILWQI